MQQSTLFPIDPAAAVAPSAEPRRLEREGEIEQERPTWRGVAILFDAPRVYVVSASGTFPDHTQVSALRLDR